MIFLEPLSKYSCRFTKVLFITLNLDTLVPVDHPNLLCDGISISGVHQEVLDGSCSFEMYLYPMFVADDLDTLIESFCIWHYHMVFFFGSSGFSLLFVLLEASV